MVERCERVNSDKYASYGAIGIRPCERLRDPANFAAEMGERPAGTELDRIDPEWGYWCGGCDECNRNGWWCNVRWLSKAENARRGFRTARRNRRRKGRLEGAV